MSNLHIDSLKNFGLFREFSDDELTRILGLLDERDGVRPGTVLFRQGDKAGDFYLVSSGAVEEVSRDSQGQDLLYRRAEAGDYLGHRALLDNSDHWGTARVVSKADLLVVSAINFRTFLEIFPLLRERLERKDVANRLLAIPLFESFSTDQVMHLADLVQRREYPEGQIIFAAGEEADAFYVVDTGQVIEEGGASARSSQTWPKYLTAGSFFGRWGLLHDAPRRATARALTDVRVFRLNKDSFDWLLDFQPKFRDALNRPDILGNLKRSGVFSELSEDNLKRLAGYVGLAHLRTGDVLYRQGEVDPTLYILYEGEAVVRTLDDSGKERPVEYLKAFRLIGQSSLFLHERRDVTVEATTPTNWCYLTRSDLDRFWEQHPEVEAKVVPRQEVQTKRGLRHLTWMAPGEQLVLMSRRHWIVLINRMTVPVILLSLALLLVFLPISAFGLLRGLGIVLAVPLFVWTLWRFIDWINDFFYVTTERVAHQERVLWINETRDEAPLDKVQNVNINQGFLGNYLDFGDLLIDTAAGASVARVTFTYLPHPKDAQALIFRMMQAAHAGQELESRREIRGRLESRIGKGLSPDFPRPAIPVEQPQATSFSGPGIGRRLYNATWDRVFWIKKETGNRVTWRKHWLRLLIVVWKPLLAVLVVAGGWIALATLAGPASPVVSAIMLILLLSTLGWLWWDFENWGNDLYIVTNDRLIDYVALPLGFRSTQTETTFEKVQNVNYKIPGPVANFFNYGTVTIFTAGPEGQLTFEWVRDPRGVQREIFRRLNIYEENRRRDRLEEQWEMMPEWFAVFEEIRKS